MNDITPGITFPDDGRRVYSESWSYEQEMKAQAMARRIQDILSAGIQSGGDVSVAGVGTIQVGPTVAYDDEGRRIEIATNTTFSLPASIEYRIVIRHLFESVPGHEPDMHGTIVEHRRDSFEIVARDSASVAEPGDVPLRVVTNSSGSVSLGSDLRQKRNLSISGDALVEGSLRVLGEATSIETTNQKIKDNIITLNDGDVGPGVTRGSSGFEIDRGSGEAKATFLYNESNDRFQAGLAGSESPIVRESEFDSRFEGYGSGKAQVHWDRVTTKPAQATRWPTLAEVTNKIAHGDGGELRLKRSGNNLYWDIGDSDWRPFA